jgi:predicted  nucleic acid-binding Zn-ribbon protein
LLQKIRQVKRAQDELADIDPQLGTDRYNEAFGKLEAFFNSQEALMDAQNEAATKANRDLIETLEEQIEGYSRQIGAFERDLDKISEKESEINKAYDKKVKALQDVKKLNQDIINQQKSQLSIANALSQGDVSAAASAIQDARAQNAAAQGDIQGQALEAGRDSQLNAITEGGLTRAQIEEKIKGLKKNISDIEIGSLRTAQDAVKAANDANDSAKLLLDYKGKTRQQWTDESLAVEAAKNKAIAYEAEVLESLNTATKLVKQWNSLDKTIVTNHVINTTYTGTGPSVITPEAAASSTKNPYAGMSADAATAWAASAAKKKGVLAAKGGMLKPSFFAKGGFAKGTDTVPAMLTPGEFVINRAESEKFAPLLSSINDGSMSRGLKTYSTPVYNMPERSYAPQGPSGLSYSTSSNPESSTAIDNSVYNYNLSVKVEGSNLNANDVANQVMNKIKQVDAQRMRNQVIR